MNPKNELKIWFFGGIAVFALGFLSLTPTKYGYTSGLFPVALSMVMFGYLNYYKEDRKKK